MGLIFFFLMRSQPNVSLFLSLSPYWVPIRNWEGLPRHLCWMCYSGFFPARPLVTGGKCLQVNCLRINRFDLQRTSLYLSTLSKATGKSFFISFYLYSGASIYCGFWEYTKSGAPSPIWLVRCEFSLLYKRSKTGLFWKSIYFSCAERQAGNN